MADQANKIFLLARPDDDGGPAYDTVEAFVVIAPSEFEARKAAAYQAGAEGGLVWAFEVTCVIIGDAMPDQKAGVVLRDYTNGA